MNYNSIRHLAFLSTLLALCLTSCTRVTDLTPEGRGEVVVVCVLTEKTPQKLTLDLTDIASPSDRDALSGAAVTLSDEKAGTEIGQFQKRDGNGWTLDYAAVPEHRYRLEVLIPGREKLEARTTMPPRSGISYRFVFSGVGFSDREEDDRELGMLYSTQSLPEGPVWVMGVNRDVSTGRYEVAPQIATSLSIADPFNVTDAVFRGSDFLDEKVLKELERINETDKAEFYGNVEGHPLYDRMLRIPSSREADREAASYPPGYFSVAGPFNIDFEFDFNRWVLIESEETGYILFISPSYEYDLFLRETLSKKMQQDKWGDYASIFSRQNVYSNIDNGLGVFGARTEQKLPWNKTIHGIIWINSSHMRNVVHYFFILAVATTASCSKASVETEWFSAVSFGVAEYELGLGWPV